MSNRTASRRRPSFWGVVSVGAVLVFLALLVYPLLRMVVSSFTTSGPAGQDLLSIYAEVFTKAYYLEALGNSLLLATLAMVGAVLIGVPLAYCVSRFPIPGKLVIRAAVVLTFVSPPFIGAYAWVLLFGSSGLITDLFAGIGITVPSIYGWPGLTIVLILQGIPFVFLMVSSALKSIDQSVEDAAINLGQRPLSVVFSVILPLIVPAISTGALLVFVTAFSDFGTPSIIGQNLRVFPRIIYSEFVNEAGGNFQLANALSAVLLVVTVGALFVQRWFARRNSFGQESVRPLGIRSLGRGQRAIATVFVYGLLFAACLPLLVVVVTSFLKSKKSVITGEFTLDGYLEAPRVWESLLNTIGLTTVATLCCVIAGCLIGYVIARRRGAMSTTIDIFSMVPYAVAGVVLGIAFSISFGGSPLFLAGTPLILILVYFIRRLPYSIRSVSGMLSQVGTQTEEASVNLGVPPGRTFLLVTLPIIAPAVVSGALLTWATVVREFNATVILYGTDTTTMSVEVFKQVIAGNFGAASVVGTLLIGVSLIPIIILFRAMGKDEDFLV